jgi:hypothetical protein
VPVDREDEDEVEAAVEAPAPKKKRPSRRGKSSSKSTTSSSSRRTPKRTPPKLSSSSSSESKAKVVADEAPVVKTGSADKHLADDEPVDEPQVVRRPRARDDLDAIPDDFD